VPHEAAHAHDNRFLRWVDSVYRPLFEFALRRRRAGHSDRLAPVCRVRAPNAMGSEFMPKLGRATSGSRHRRPASAGDQRAATSGRSAASCSARGRGRAKRRYPEIPDRGLELGRPDEAPILPASTTSRCFAPLLPQGEWRPNDQGMLTVQLSRELRERPRGRFQFLPRAIADNVEEAMSGVKGENTVKVWDRI